MRRSLGAFLIALLFPACGALALEAQGVIAQVDAANREIVLTVRGGDRRLAVAPAAVFQDAENEPLAGGIESAEIRQGAEVTVTVERIEGRPAIVALRMGLHEAAAPVTVQPPTGLKPLDEMTAEDIYKGEDGGLYGGGRNTPPEAHQAAAEAETARIAPLGAGGNLDDNGRIVIVSISMSNATQEFSVFKRIADADPEKSPLVTIVDCAQGGQAMAQWVDPQGRAWLEADRRLAAAGISPQQVQVAWIKMANVRPTGGLEIHGRRLQRDTQTVLQNAKARFPNLRVAYLGSRIYGGYATGQLNPEPYAYEGAFAVRWLIQEQIKGEPELNYDPERGEVKAPLLLWGPYLWADGVTPRRSDGLTWQRADMVADGVHPSESGRRKVADMLLNFFKTDPNTRTWFVRPE